VTLSSHQMDYAGFVRAVPEINAAMSALGAAVDASGLAKDLTELVKLRASQINDCTFCIQLHLNVAKKVGIAAGKLDRLADWRASDMFSAREKAALAWTELLTAGIAGGVTADDRAALASEFSESEIVHLTVTVGTINQWNRISMGLGFGPPAATA
jgi:AhpD family alkylhydroperoxidase